MELWRDIKGYEGYFQISNLGNVKRLAYKTVQNKYLEEKIVTPHLTINKYKRVALRDGKPHTIHIMVAQHFPEICGEWFDGAEVHHKDFNSLNNIADNLVVLSKEEHRKLHSESVETYKHKSEAQKKSYADGINKSNPVKRAIEQYTLDGKYIKTWDSIAMASKTLKISQGAICSCCSGTPNSRGYIVHSAGGFIWKYADPLLKNNIEKRVS